MGQRKSNRAIDSDARQALFALAGARHRGRYAAREWTVT